MRWPGRIAAGWMGTIALFSTPKPKDAPKTNFDHVKENCGKIAFACMLPTVFEEGMASYKGIKIARKTGLAEPLIKNLEKIIRQSTSNLHRTRRCNRTCRRSCKYDYGKIHTSEKVEQDSFYNLFIWYNFFHFIIWTVKNFDSHAFSVFISGIICILQFIIRGIYCFFCF